MFNNVLSCLFMFFLATMIETCSHIYCGVDFCIKLFFLVTVNNSLIIILYTIYTCTYEEMSSTYINHLRGKYDK